MTNRIKIFSVLLCTSLLSACSTIVNGPEAALSVEEEHPISVDQQTVTLSVAVDLSLSDLTQLDKARLSAFADSYFKKGHGALTITAPSGGRYDYYGQEVASDIRQHLHARGVSWSEILGATYRVSGDNENAEVLVTFSHYVASASECGDWSREFSRRFKNMRSKNFGCAQQSNLAAMISDPRDLVASRSGGENNPNRVVDIYNKFENGQSTSSAADSSMEVSTSDTGQ